MKGKEEERFKGIINLLFGFSKLKGRDLKGKDLKGLNEYFFV